MSGNERSTPSIDVVAGVLRDAGFRQAIPLPNDRGITEGFNVFGDASTICVSHYVPCGTSTDNIARRAGMLSAYAEVLSRHFTVKRGDRNIVVSQKQTNVHCVLDDEELAGALRSAYQHGGERTREAWLAVAQRARELLSR